MTEDNILDTYVKHTQPGQVFTGWKVYFGPGVNIKNYTKKVKIHVFPK